jgi:hypothetical protein
VRCKRRPSHLQRVGDGLQRKAVPVGTPCAGIVQEEQAFLHTYEGLRGPQPITCNYRGGPKKFEIRWSARMRGYERQRGIT